MRNEKLSITELSKLVSRYKQAKKQSTRNKLYNYVYHNYSLSFTIFQKLTLN